MISSDFRAEARRKLDGKWKQAVLSTLAYVLVFFLIEFIAGLFPESMDSVFSIITTIIEMPLSFGLVYSFVKLYNEEDVKAFDFLSLGFSNFARAWKIYLHILLKMIVPVILVFVFAIITNVGLLTAATTSTIFSSSSAGTGSMIVAIIGFILFIVSMIWAILKSYYYQLANLVAIDNPSLSAKEAVMKSKDLMTGNRGKLFCLQLSFIGWTILSVFTICIGYLWLLPYMQFAIIAFYKFVNGDNSTVDAKVVTENYNPIQGE